MSEMIGHVAPKLPVSQWWLSFVDEHFLGVIVIDATDLVSAITQTHRLGINPGGEIKAVGPLPAGSIGSEWCGRLLTREEAESIPEPDQTSAWL